MEPTISQVNRAGRVLRNWAAYAAAGKLDELTGALEVLAAFRSAHAQPLAKASSGLRSMLRSESCPVEVSQRLKRSATIIDKLSRQPTMALSRMQDIGGCRAVVQDLAELRRVEKRIRANRPPVHVTDYVENPKASGYRGVHLIVTYDDRQIEIQLRTQLMHQWAVAVERYGGKLGEDLKSGSGPAEVLDWLRSVSAAVEMEERGQQVDVTLKGQVSYLRQAALPQFSEENP